MFNIPVNYVKTLFHESFLFQLVMDDGDPLLDEYFLDLPAGFLEEPVCQNQDDCPPPLFLLPPPPRPPEMGDSCSSLSPYESCDNIIIIDSQVKQIFILKIQVWISYLFRPLRAVRAKLWPF